MATHRQGNTLVVETGVRTRFDHWRLRETGAARSSGSKTLSSVNPEAPPLCQVTDDYTVIGRSLFKKETNMQLFVGLKVALSTGEAGVIEGGFGQSGKYKIRVAGRPQRPSTHLVHTWSTPGFYLLTPIDKVHIRFTPGPHLFNTRSTPV